jgi:hypothetical protein
MAKNNSDKSSNFLGWQGRSGLDPVDTYRTEAHVEGVFLRRLFTLKLRTRNIFSLLAMLIFGVGATSLMGFAFYGLATSRSVGKLDLTDYLLAIPFYFVLGLIFFIGLALLLNFVVNVAIMLGIIKNTKQRISKEAKKKLPKRRKDYR